MESNVESIRLLKKRMHHQMSTSSENDIKPENIQYYVSSLMMQREDIQKNISAEEERVEADIEESEVYEEMPADTEYIKKPEEIPPVMKDIKVPETTETQHEKAKNEYEKVLNAADEEEIFGFRGPHWLNIKG